MRVRSSLVREPSDRLGRQSPLQPIEPRRGRPERKYRIRIHNLDDVRTARSLGLPIWAATGDLVSALGVPMVMPPTLAVWRPLLDAMETDFRTHGVEKLASATQPKIEDLAVLLLRFDPLAARAMLLWNREFVDSTRLLCAVIEEGAQRLATEVDLQEIAPGIPRVGPTLPMEALRRQDRDRVVVGLL